MPKQIPPILMYHELLLTSPFSQWISYNSSLYTFDKSYYRKIDKNEGIREILHYFDRENHVTEARLNYVDELYGIFIALSQNKRTKGFNRWLLDNDQPGYYIPVKNGIIYISNESFELKLMNPSKHFFNIFKPTSNYRKKFNPRKLYLFFKSLELTNDEIKFIREFMGYCLVYNTELARILILLGEGEDGKSVLINLFKRVIGKENYSVLNINELDGSNRFKLIQTEGKTLNVYEEMPKSSSINWDVVKHITTGGEISVEQKGIAARNIVSTIKILLSANELPDINDRSKGTKRRLVIIKFIKSFSNPEIQKPELLTDEYWEDEIDHILSWAIHGLRNLLNRGHFLEPQSSRDIKENHFLEQNIEKQFLIDNFVFDSSSHNNMPTGKIYSLYSEYCKENGFTKKDTRVLGKEISRTFKNIQKSKNAQRVPDWPKRTRIWKGLKLKTHEAQDIPTSLENSESNVSDVLLSQTNELTTLPKAPTTNSDVEL